MFNFIIFVLQSVFLTKLVTVGILFSTAVKAAAAAAAVVVVVVAKFVILGIFF